MKRSQSSLLRLPHFATYEPAGITPTSVPDLPPIMLPQRLQFGAVRAVRRFWVEALAGRRVPALAGGQEIGRVDDRVGVALFGQEALPVGGVVGVVGVP